MPILLPQLVQVSRSYRKYLPTSLAPLAHSFIGESYIAIGWNPPLVITFMVLDAVALEVSLFWFYDFIRHHKYCFYLSSSIMEHSFWLQVDSHEGHAVIRHRYALDRSLQVVCTFQLKPLPSYMSNPS